MTSKRINHVIASPIVQFNDLIIQREKYGIKFYKANIGQPNFKMKKSYFKDLKKIKINNYSDAKGLFELRKTYISYFNDKLKCKKYNMDNVIITQGASDAIQKVLYTICDVGDEILVLEPFFADYKIYCNLLEIKMKAINYYDIDRTKIEKKITKKTKAILFSNPNNPDGNVLDEKSIKILIDIAKKNNLYLISDEVYNEILYDKKYLSLGHFNYKNLIIIDSASKKLNACGSRIGFVVTENLCLINKLRILNDSKISISNIEQIGITNLLKKCNKIIKNNNRIYLNRLNKLMKLLENTDLKIIPPKGGISVLIELPFNNSNEYVKWLITNYEKNKKTLLVTSAKEFYLTNAGNNKIRFCLTINEKELKEAVNILVDSCNKFMEMIK